MLKNAPLLLLLIALLGLGACTSARRGAGLPAGSAPPPGQQALQQPALAGTSLPGGLAGSLPNPAQLAGKLGPAARRSSYLPEDLARPGDGFDPLLPSQNIQDGNGDIAMVSTFGQPGSPGFSGAAYASYRFTLPDYEGNSLISYSMTNAPATEADLYIGLANWGANRWDLFQGSAGHSVSPPSLAPYFLPDGSLLALVLLVGVNSLELSSIRVGSPPPEVTLTATPRFGLAPMTVNFSAAGASDPDGSIVQYRWDPEGDGVFDLSTGAEPTLQHEYTQQGSFDAAVRVFDDQGVYSEQHLTINTANRSMFSYGTQSTMDFGGAVVVCADGHLMVFGQSRDQSLFETLRVDKFSPEGSLDFSLSVPIASAGNIVDAHLAGDGFIYAVGQTNQNAKGDVLIQKWSQDGELLWTRRLGGPDDSEFFSSISVSGGKIYLGGHYFVDALGRSLGLAACLDSEGTPEWFTSLIAPESAFFSSMAIMAPSQVLDGGLAFCGSYQHSQSDTDALFAFIDFQGNLDASRILGEDGSFESATAIVLSGGVLPTTYIVGNLSGGDRFLYRSGITDTVVSFTASDGVPIFVNDLALVGGQATVLLQHSTSIDTGTPLLAAFDGTLSQTESLLVLGGDATQIFNADLANYGNGSFVLSGRIRHELPQTTDNLSLNISPSALAWSDISPANGSPTTLELSTLNLTPIVVSNFQFNRQASDEDVFVMLDATS
ncbi:PKD domain-containing protein [bacterium]|nr:PKD domain-containing protein [bacterium]